MRGSLFWKFFLAFWLALLVAGIGVGSAVWWRHRDDSSLIRGVETHGPARTIVAAAYATYSHSGFSAFRSVLKEWSKQEDVPLFAVNDAGMELLGRKMDAQLVAQARVMLGSGRYNDVVREVTDEQGQRYLLFVPAHGFSGPPPPEPSHRDGSPNGSRPPPEVDGQRAMRADAPPPPGFDDHPRDQEPPPDTLTVLRDAIHAFNVLEREPRPPGPPEQRTPWLPIFAGLIASVFFSALAAWSLSKPIRVLRDGFKELAGGRFDTRIAEQMGKRSDELEALGADFDSMAGQLQTLMEAQQRLLHDVSHELRSPLARLQAAIGLARQQPAKVGDMLERIELESGRLDGLIGELLTLSRLEAGVPGGMEERIVLDDLLAALVADAQFEAEPRQIHVELACPPGVIVVGRNELLARAIENVIRNAIHYSPEAAVVVVSVKTDTGHVVVQVLDHGPGVRPDELAHLFKPFFRSETVQSSVGHGLGLAIARRAIDAHGGTISVSNRVGGGLCVEIRLPLAIETA